MIKIQFDSFKYNFILGKDVRSPICSTELDFECVAQVKGQSYSVQISNIEFSITSHCTFFNQICKNVYDKIGGIDRGTYMYKRIEIGVCFTIMFC